MLGLFDTSAPRRRIRSSVLRKFASESGRLIKEQFPWVSAPNRLGAFGALRGLPYYCSTEASPRAARNSMSSEIMRQIVETIEADVQMRPSGIKFEMAYQARVAIDRIKFAIRHAEQFGNPCEAMREAGCNCLTPSNVSKPWIAAFRLALELPCHSRTEIWRRRGDEQGVGTYLRTWGDVRKCA
jgi:hypothetical protein